MRLQGVCLAIVLVIFAAAEVRAQDDPFARNMQKEQRILDSLRQVAPQQVETFRAATQAIDGGKPDEAVKLYTEVLKAAPNFDPAMRRLGGALIDTGHGREGFALLYKAVEVKRSPENLITLAQYLDVFGDDTNTTAAERSQALSFATEANNLNDDRGDMGYPAVLANVSLHMQRLD